MSNGLLLQVLQEIGKLVSCLLLLVLQERRRGLFFLNWGVLEEVRDSGVRLITVNVFKERWHGSIISDGLFNYWVLVY
jgi:hypothetical protein